MTPNLVKYGLAYSGAEKGSLVYLRPSLGIARKFRKHDSARGIARRSRWSRRRAAGRYFTLRQTVPPISATHTPAPPVCKYASCVQPIYDVLHR